MAKIAIIVGSVRQNRQGIKVARWMEGKLKERGHTVYFIDPLELNLPLLDKMYKEIIDPAENLKQLRNQIVEAEGYMPITPEYNHSISAALKNTLDYFLEEYYFKPSAIVSYSVGGFGGVNAVQHLRGIFAELGAHLFIIIFIYKVQNVLDDAGKLREQLYEKRVIRFIEEFEWYIDAFKNQRAKGTPY
ncbi:MAG TPA: NAD(P)H-dependent oxidoreductase [Nitrososphaeraceae archaeon]|nr:NAD(P)H-dependent oxidoreductase [Nitrososphaeraceae archaeon]